MTRGEHPATIAFSAEMWVWSSEKTAWHFITLTPEAAARIRFYAGEKKRGWGSVPVVATIGRTRWRTSIFPDKKSNSFLLPVKAEVRKTEKIAEGDRVKVSIAPENV